MTAAMEVEATEQECIEPDWARVLRVIEFQIPDRPLSDAEKLCAVWLMLDRGMQASDIRERVKGLTKSQYGQILQLRTAATFGEEAALALAPPFEMRYWLGTPGIYRPGSDLVFIEMFGDVVE